MAGVVHDDLTGKVFGLLTVISRSADRGAGSKPVVKWNCLCACGKMVCVSSASLKNKHNVSCGCKKVKHMESYKHMTRLYNIWKGMRQRCNNPNNPSYERYGKRGIQICPEWSEYAAFKAWAIVNGYSDSMSIDRIDNDGNYCPDNCRWVDTKVQNNNTRRNHFVDFRGERRTMAEVADILNVSYSTIQHRVERGKPLEG